LREEDKGSEKDGESRLGARDGGEETVAAGSTERLATVVVPAAAGWWWFAVTQWWNGGTKDTTVRRKRVVMGRESRGVLLLVALAVLAAADAFSTDSKSALFFIKTRNARLREASEGGTRGGGTRGRAGPEAWIVYTQLQGPRRNPRPVSRSFLAASLDDIATFRRIFQLRLRSLPSPSGRRVNERFTDLNVALSFSVTHSRADYLSRY